MALIDDLNNAINDPVIGLIKKVNDLEIGLTAQIDGLRASNIKFNYTSDDMISHQIANIKEQINNIALINNGTMGVPVLNTTSSMEYNISNTALNPDMPTSVGLISDDVDSMSDSNMVRIVEPFTEAPTATGYYDVISYHVPGDLRFGTYILELRLKIGSTYAGEILTVTIDNNIVNSISTIENEIIVIPENEYKTVYIKFDHKPQGSNANKLISIYISRGAFKSDIPTIYLDYVRIRPYTPEL